MVTEDKNDRSDRYINAFTAVNDLENILCGVDSALSDNYWMNKIRHILAVSAGEPTTALTPELLASMWSIGSETAKNSLSSTTQSIIRQAVYLLGLRYWTAHKQFFYDHFNDKFYTDVMFSGLKPLSSNTCATVFVNRPSCVYVHTKEEKH